MSVDMECYIAYQQGYEAGKRDAAAAIEDLEARLGEAENSVERWKDMYLTKHEPKRGEWELIDGAEPMRWGCSRCKYMSWETSTYCPRCGAKMEVQDGQE